MKLIVIILFSWILVACVKSEGSLDKAVEEIQTRQAEEKKQGIKSIFINDHRYIAKEFELNDRSCIIVQRAYDQSGFQLDCK